MMRCALPPMIAAALLLSGCGHSPETRFLTMDAVPPAAPDRAAFDYSGLPIRVASVRLPAAYDRRELVRETAGGRVEIRDFAQWIAPPATLARETLTRDLVARLPQGKVLASTAPASRADLDLSVDILSFSAGNGAAIMQASYQIADRSRIIEIHAAGAEDPASWSDALGQLADHIARDLAD